LSFENVTSVIIPAHNEQAVVGRCIESLARDAGADTYQVIVVANGCSDDTAEVVRQAWERVDVLERTSPRRATP
jgi:glycosyltransferase involved in cell wall biosynthesis